MLSPAYSTFARYDVTLAVIEAEVFLYVARAPTGQAVHADVAGVAHALRLACPLVHCAL